MKFFFDNCIPRPIVAPLRRLARAEGEDDLFMHLTQLFAAEALDEEWLPLLRREDDWVIVTKDKGSGHYAAPVWLGNRNPVFRLAKGWPNVTIRPMCATLAKAWAQLRHLAAAAPDFGRWSIDRYGAITPINRRR